MPNILPILLLAGGAAVVMGKKKKKKKTAAVYDEVPEAPDGPPLPLPMDETEPPQPPPPATETGEPGLSTGAYEGPEPGKPVASGVERYFTGAYPWKILFTDQGDYAGHHYPMGPHGPHQEVVRGATSDQAIANFKFWATNEDRRKRNLPPILRATAVQSTTAPKHATLVPKKSEGGTLGGN